jgi:hypothetical protein
VARAQGLLPALLSRWQRHALAKTVFSSAEREKTKLLCCDFKRVEQERDVLKKSRDNFWAVASVMSRCQFVKQIAQVVCRVLHVSPVG